MFEVRNITFAYWKRPVLRDVSFVVSPGETVAVVGANGAGKTTLMNILATVVEPDGGHVICEGRDAFAEPIRYRRQLGYLPEAVFPYEDMSVKEYLNYRASLKGEQPKRIRRRVGEAVELCRVGDLLRRRIGSLSVGLRKRVALADALMMRPRVLLLDDFLSGLDSQLRQAAGEIISEAAAFSSVIVSGHELEDLARWTTRFLVLRNGVIASTVTAAGGDPSVVRERLHEAISGGVS